MEKKTAVIISVIFLLLVAGFIVYMKMSATFLGGTIPTKAECSNYVQGQWCQSGYHCVDCYQYTAVNGALSWSSDCFLSLSSFPSGKVDVCSNNVCVIGDQRCSADTTKVERCRANSAGTNTEWYTYSTCSSTQYCPASSSSCKTNPSICTPNSQRCNGNIYEICTASSTWYQMQPLSTSCSDTTSKCIPGTNNLCTDTIIVNGNSYYCKVPVTTCSSGCSGDACVNTNVCTPSSKECVSPTQYRQCNSAGTAWLSDTTCPTGQTCSGAGVCAVPTICTAGAVRCASGSAIIKETCNSAGTAWTQTSCSTGQTCSAGQCVSSVNCQPNAIQCSSDTLYKQCNSAGTAWSSDISCASGQVCSANGCVNAAQCTAANAAVNCNDNNACTTDSCLSGTCSNQAVICPSGLSCVNGNCVTPPQCTGNTQCNDGNPCTTDTCLSNICDFAPIIGCGGSNSTVCRAYQELYTNSNAQEDCRFSFSKLFVRDGFSQYYSDNTAMFWIVVLAVVLIIILLIWAISSRSNNNGPSGLW